MKKSWLSFLRRVSDTTCNSGTASLPPVQINAEGAEKRGGMCQGQEGRRKILKTVLRGGGAEEVLKDLKEGEEFRKLRGDVRVDISDKGPGVPQSSAETDIPGATTYFVRG